MRKQRKPYRFQLFSMFLKSWEVLLGSDCRICLFACQYFPGPHKPGKPLEHVQFSFLFYEKHRKPLEYVCFSFGNKENLHIPIDFQVLTKQKRKPQIFQQFSIFSRGNNEIPHRAARQPPLQRPPPPPAQQSPHPRKTRRDNCTSRQKTFASSDVTLRPNTMIS